MKNSVASELGFYTAPSGRVYADVAEVARVTGLRAMDLDFKYKPNAWASPRDFIWAHGRLWLAVLSLPQMVDALFDAGQGDAAILLREQVGGWIEQLAATYLDTGTAPASSGTAGGRQAERLPREHATPPAARVLSGAEAQSRWEAEHS